MEYVGVSEMERNKPNVLNEFLIHCIKLTS